VIEPYAITDDPAPHLPAGAALSAVAHEGLALVYAPASDLNEVTPEQLWRHEEVVEALMDDRDLLPVRFGARLEDEAAAVRTLRERHAELSRALDSVRGAVELSVRVSGDRGAGQRMAEAESGIEYLRAKASATAAQESARRRVHEPLSLIARESMEHPPHRAGELLRAAYLVDRAAVDDFVGRVAELQRTAPELQVLCTGPWPPYSFSER
jgi:hypothetical protein